MSTLTLYTACDKNNRSEKIRESSIPQLKVSFLKAYPHDINSFTEGLLFHDGKLYESTGSPDLPNTRSILGEVDLITGKIDVKVELDREKYFGEGIVYLDDCCYQLTYKARICFVYDANSYEKIQEFTIPSDEGWGLTTDGKYLIMSDGTHKLTYLDPLSFKVVRKLSVTEDHVVKPNLNELEYVDSYIYANIWMTDEIVKIDPKDGKIIAKLDLSTYTKDAKGTNPNAEEMNGIAYNPERSSFFITGKLWPKLYEIRIEK